MIKFTPSLVSTIVTAALACVISWSSFSAELPASVTSPDKGLVSAGVYDSSERLVRTLASAQEVPGGAVKFNWDGTNDLGLPAQAGDYHVKGVWFPSGPKIKFLMKVGISGDPPYVSADQLGGWGGNLAPAYGLCSNGKNMLAAFGCVEDNVNTGVQLMDANGKILKRYFTFFPWDTRFAAAMDQTNFYMVIASLDKRVVIAKYDLNTPRGKILCDIPTTEHTEKDGRWKGRWITDCRGLAINNGRLYAPMVLEDKLFVFDKDSGKLLNTVDVPSPRGVAAANGKLVLLSEKRLIEIDADGKPGAVLIGDGLDDPSGVAVGAAGDFFITDGGRAQQVKVFGSDGKLKRAIGAAGGRPRNGVFDPKGMLDPAGICVGPDGRIWVAERNEVFMRVSVWDAESGKLSTEFFNTRISSGQGELSGDRTEMIFKAGAFSDYPALLAYKVDFKTGTWYPSWSAAMAQSDMQQNDVFLGGPHLTDKYLKALFDGRTPYLGFTGGVIKADNGRTYAYGGDCSIYLLDEATKAPKLAAFVYTHRVHKTKDGVFEGDYDQGPNNWLAWSDLNGDGKMAVDECVFTENSPLMTNVKRLFSWQLQSDLSLLMLCPEVQPDKVMNYVVRKLSPNKILPSGVPVYNWADVKTVVQLHVPSYEGGDGTKGGKLLNTMMDMHVHDGEVDAAIEPRSAHKMHLAGIDGDGWWASRNWRQTPLRFDLKGGEPLGFTKLGRRAPGKAKSGEMYFPRPFAGVIDGFLFVPDTVAQQWVWTDSGLYVGRLYHETWENIRDDKCVSVELTGAFTYKIDGKIYACTGDHGVAVHEVELPALTKLDGGAFTLTPEMTKTAKAWDPDGPLPGKRPTYIAHNLIDIATKKRLKTIDIDGHLEDWSGTPYTEIFADGKPVAKLYAAWDADKLYLAYDVTDAAGFTNIGSELPLCPFVSGAYVDFNLAPNWSTPNYEAPLANDVRVIMAHIQGSPPSEYQMGYWPVKAGGKHPQTIVSPAASRKFDDVAPVEGLKFASAETDHGYVVELSVPFKSLNMNPNVGANRIVGFDASVGIANKEGAVRKAAYHWAGETEALVVDRPGSSALLPGTWGTLVFDATP